jgi:hypothetical protein
MKTLKQFLTEAISKRSVLSIFKKKLKLNISYEEMFKVTLKEIFPHVIQTTNEENDSLLHNLVNMTKNIKLIQPLSKNFVTKNEIVRSDKFVIAINLEIKNNKLIVKHQFSIPEGRNFRDNEMIEIIDGINRVIGECLDLLSSKEPQSQINFTEEHTLNDILYTFVAKIYTINIDEKNHLLFYIPKSIKEIDEDLDLSGLSLTHLPEYLPDTKGYFDCSDNQLTSLKGCPKNIGNYFYCFANKLTSLKGCPKIIKGVFNCSINKLSSFEGGPEYVEDDFYCSENSDINSLEGIPKQVDGDFLIRNVGKKFTQDEIRAICKVKGKVKFSR